MTATYQSQLTARINRFMDRKMAKTLDKSEISKTKFRSPRRMTNVSDSPYIALAIK